MNRRKFIGAVAGLAVAPILPALPMPVAEISGKSIAIANRLFSSEIGRYSGIRITEGAARMYSKALAVEVMRKSHLRGLMVGLGMERA